jgi:hypothetical protein
MASTPEGKVKAAVKKELAKYPETYAVWPVPSGYGPSTLDCVGCHYDRFFAVETKAPGKNLTPRQKQMVAAIKAAGGMAFVIDDVDAIGGLAWWLSITKTQYRRLRRATSVIIGQAHGHPHKQKT